MMRPHQHGTPNAFSRQRYRWIDDTRKPAQNAPLTPPPLSQHPRLHAPAW
ncbi:unnamed protein product [Dibothriocephalus latus]|uniref:Uncharacterized protein n=1 Tax=Dibothriocephalus latus TaxID=60516 RepID=A0A3P7ME97_DIBLA|nr:unnamed protein product [Dibothriocephalus latus]